MLEQVLLIILCVAGLAALSCLALVLRRGLRMDRADRRTDRLLCPHCTYPLRFNGTEYWCSECGYKHPVKVDNDSASGDAEVDAED